MMEGVRKTKRVYFPKPFSTIRSQSLILASYVAGRPAKPSRLGMLFWQQYEKTKINWKAHHRLVDSQVSWQKVLCDQWYLIYISHLCVYKPPVCCACNTSLNLVWVWSSQKCKCYVYTRVACKQWLSSLIILTLSHYYQWSTSGPQLQVQHIIIWYGSYLPLLLLCVLLRIHMIDLVLYIAVH